MAVLYDSSGVVIRGTTGGQNSSQNALLMRPCHVDSTTATVRLATAGDNAILSSAGTVIYVYGISFSMSLGSTGTSTGSSGALVQLQTGTTGVRQWSYNYQPSSLASAMDSICVAPPSYIFRVSSGNALNAAANSTGGYISVAAWRE